MFTQPFIQTQIKENVKAPRHWPLCGDITGDRWIPRTNGQLRGKCHHDSSRRVGNDCHSWIWLLIYSATTVFSCVVPSEFHLFPNIKLHLAGSQHNVVAISTVHDFVKLSDKSSFSWTISLMHGAIMIVSSVAQRVFIMVFVHSIIVLEWTAYVSSAFHECQIPVITHRSAICQAR